MNKIIGYIILALMWLAGFLVALYKRDGLFIFIAGPMFLLCCWAICQAIYDYNFERYRHQIFYDEEIINKSSEIITTDKKLSQKEIDKLKSEYYERYKGCKHFIKS